MSKAQARDTLQPQLFDLKIPLLEKGRSHKIVAETDIMNVAMKCYAEGGENTLHTHPGQDHTFIVLDGQARFFDKNGEVGVVGKNQGILAPKGWYYYFESCGDEPLVMLRFGAYMSQAARLARTGMDGHVMPPDSKENKHGKPVAIPGRFFG